MGLTWFGTIIDSHDPDRLARFWCQVLGYVVVFRNDTEVAIAPDNETHPGLAFVQVDGAKTQKNRLHLDLRPDDQATEVQRLRTLGAHLVNIDQGQVSWVVMGDPEGNEFCVLNHWTD